MTAKIQDGSLFPLQTLDPHAPPYVPYILTTCTCVLFAKSSDTDDSKREGREEKRREEELGRHRKGLVSRCASKLMRPWSGTGHGRSGQAPCAPKSNQKCYTFSNLTHLGDTAIA